MIHSLLPRIDMGLADAKNLSLDDAIMLLTEARQAIEVLIARGDDMAESLRGSLNTLNKLRNLCQSQQ